MDGPAPDERSLVDDVFDEPERTTVVKVNRNAGKDARLAKSNEKAAEPLTKERGSAPKTKEQKRREAEARNRAYAALKNHRKRIAQLDEQMERDNARMEEILTLLADPDFYINETESTNVIAEHAQLKQRLAAAEEEWFLLTEELEAEMAKQAAQV